jgi:hypothetical protein
MRSSSVIIDQVEGLRDVESGHLDVDQPVEGHRDQALVAFHGVPSAGAVAPGHGDAVGALFDGGDGRAESGVREQERAEGLRQGGRPVGDELEVAEDVVVPVDEPLDQREVESTLEVE